MNSRKKKVCRVDELKPGERKIITVNNKSIGVFNIDGEFYAIQNVCPHHFAPLCEGELTGEITSDEVGEFNMQRDGEIIRCPWHGWKFDIKSGESVLNPVKLKTITYDVEIERSSRGTDESEEDPEDTNIQTYDVGVEQDMVVVYFN